MAEVLDVYLRVSRVGGRDSRGDSYKSPELQREAIEQWARLNEVEVGRVVKDEDVSGAKAVADRGLEKLIERAENGLSDGVAVYRIDRFGRDAVHVLTALKRLTDADARLVAVQEGLDSSTDAGRLVIGIMVQLAEYHLGMLKTGWSRSVTKAVEEGKHVASRAPLGYLRADAVDPRYTPGGDLIKDARLVPDPAIAPLVTEAFERKAAGASHGEVVAFLNEGTGRKMSKSGVTGVLQNRAYLGEARGPNGSVNKSAHPPLVDEDTFARVKARAGTRVLRKESLSAQARLRGLITCASCGHKLQIVGSTNHQTGEREASYACQRNSAAGTCEAPAGARVTLVDDYVAELLANADDDVAAGVASVEQKVIEARQQVEEAEAALASYLGMDAKTQLALGRNFEGGLLARQEAVDAARRKLVELEDTVGDRPVVEIGGQPYVYELWGDDPERDRAHLKAHVASVSLAKADPRRRRWQPIAERVEVRWVGE